jgi:hypothetical protein
LEIEPGESREAKERALYEKEKGLTILKESKDTDDDAKIRERMVLDALGVRIDGLKKKVESKGIELNDLAELERKVNQLKNTVSLKESERAGNIGITEETLRLIDRFQTGKLSALGLLEELEKSGFIFK